MIIEHGSNDYSQQIPPEVVEQTLREILSALQKAYPNMQLVVSSPTYCYIGKDGEKLYCDTTELGEHVLEEYIWQEQAVCDELGVIFVDNYHQDVITKDTVDAYSMDGLHLNEDGRKFLADNIEAALTKAAE